MPIRIMLILLLLAACAGAAPRPDTSTGETSQALSCGHPPWPCNPASFWSNWECEDICEGNGHCQDYSPREIAWCVAHPDKFYGPYKLCGPTGDPSWRTWCVQGPIP